MTDWSSLVHPSVTSGELKQKFAPKLNKINRCKILALLKLGYPSSILSKMFDVHLKTVLSMGRESSAHYRSLRKHFVELGAAQFNERYLTEEDIDRANSLVANRISAPVPRIADRAKPNKTAATLSGDHLVLGRKINVRWVDRGDQTGWYYYDYIDEAEIGPFNNSKGALAQSRIDIEIMLR